MYQHGFVTSGSRIMFIRYIRILHSAISPIRTLYILSVLSGSCTMLPIRTLYSTYPFHPDTVLCLSVPSGSCNMFIRHIRILYYAIHSIRILYYAIRPIRILHLLSVLSGSGPLIIHYIRTLYHVYPFHPDPALWYKPYPVPVHAYPFYPDPHR